MLVYQIPFPKNPSVLPHLISRDNLKNSKSLILQRNFYIIMFSLSDPAFSVRLIGDQISMKVIFNNFHRPLHG